MTATLDYARLFETEFRPRRRLRRALALTLLAGVLVVRPRLAVAIWREHCEIA